MLAMKMREPAFLKGTQYEVEEPEPAPLPRPARPSTDAPADAEEGPPAARPRWDISPGVARALAVTEPARSRSFAAARSPARASAGDSLQALTRSGRAGA